MRNSSRNSSSTNSTELFDLKNANEYTSTTPNATSTNSNASDNLVSEENEKASNSTTDEVTVQSDKNISLTINVRYVFFYIIEGKSL